VLLQPVFTLQDGVRFIFWGFYKSAIRGKYTFLTFWTLTQVRLLKVALIFVTCRAGPWLLSFSDLFDCIEQGVSAGFAT
jgi:hypothetical protein